MRRIATCLLALLTGVSAWAAVDTGDIEVQPPVKPAPPKPLPPKPSPDKPAPANPVVPPGKPEPPAAGVPVEPPDVNTNVAGKIKSARLAMVVTRTPLPKVQINYSYEIKTSETRIRKPIVAFYLVVQSQDGTREFTKGYDRKGNLAEKGEFFEYDIMRKYSTQEPLVPAKDARTFTGIYTDTPFLDKRGSLQVVLYRFELWVDGVMLDAYDSRPASSLKTMKIPADWYKHDSSATIF